MSTFQRILVLFIFCGLGLAAAVLIVQSPELPGLMGRLGLPELSPTRDAPADVAIASPVVEVETSLVPAIIDPPEFTQFYVAERAAELVNDSLASDENDPTFRSPSNLTQPRKLVFSEHVAPSSPLPAEATTAPLPPVPMIEPDSNVPIVEVKVETESVAAEPVVEAITAPNPVELIVPKLSAVVSVSRESRSVVQANAVADLQGIAEPGTFTGEGDGQLDINIPDTDIREVLQLLSKAGNLNILASKNVTGQVKANLTGVDVNTALAAILRSTGYIARREGEFVYVGSKEDFQAMDHAVDRVSTRVYRPNYITAAELQTLITPMLTPVIGSVSVSSAAEVGIGADSSGAGGNNFAGAEVVLVRDYDAALKQIDAVFQEVDRRPLQVSIEAMILSVKLNDEQTIGVDWDILRQGNHVRLALGSPQADLSGNAAGGLVFGYLDGNVGGFLEAVEKVGQTHVISQPRLMCLNKQRAEIHVGEERGYVSTTVTETAATQSVEFLEVGTQLRLRPFISSDGMIRLEVHPELSTGTVEVSENFTLPNKTVTQVTTNVMVRDGATLVIGGLLREDLQKDTEQIPVLGSLPVVGPLFRTKTDKLVRDEIIVLITPRIVWEPQFNCEGEHADCEFHQQHAILADKMSPISRTFQARKFRRLAKAAWVAGDAQSALRYVNRSLHYNSVDREAIQLRSEIIANSPFGDESVHSHLREGLRPWERPRGGRPLDNWVLDDMHGPHTHLGQEPAPSTDPGISGSSRNLSN